MSSPMTVRLHAPRPYEVLARVAGTVDASSVGLLVEQVTATFGAGVRVVVDLSGIAALTPAAVTALLELDRAATRRRTRLHVVGGARADTVRHAIGHQSRLDADDVSRRVDAGETAGVAAP